MDVVVFTRADGGVTVRNLPKDADADAFNTEIQHARDSGKAVNIPTRVARANVPSDQTFRNAWSLTGGIISVDMPKAREIHAERIAAAQADEIARLKVEERKERLLGNTAKADQHATDTTALEALDLNAVATQIQAAPNPPALSAVWPAFVPRPT